MDDNLFNELLGSIKQAGRIHQGKEDASRRFVYDDINVKAVREGTGLSQNKLRQPLALVFAPYRTGNKGTANHKALLWRY